MGEKMANDDLEVKKEVKRGVDWLLWNKHKKTNPTVTQMYWTGNYVEKT